MSVEPCFWSSPNWYNWNEHKSMLLSNYSWRFEYFTHCEKFWKINQMKYSNESFSFFGGRFKVSLGVNICQAIAYERASEGERESLLLSRSFANHIKWWWSSRYECVGRQLSGQVLETIPMYMCTCVCVCAQRPRYSVNWFWLVIKLGHDRWMVDLGD